MENYRHKTGLYFSSQVHFSGSYLFVQIFNSFSRIQIKIESKINSFECSDLSFISNITVHQKNAKQVTVVTKQIPFKISFVLNSYIVYKATLYLGSA